MWAALGCGSGARMGRPLSSELLPSRTPPRPCGALRAALAARGCPGGWVLVASPDLVPPLVDAHHCHPDSQLSTQPDPEWQPCQALGSGPSTALPIDSNTHFVTRITEETG